jgi:predicted aldo/keto reductase-like oxidoreductase
MAQGDYTIIMQYRKDIKSGNELSALGFGCMRFPKGAGGRIDMKKTEELIVSAIERGINYFDTARIYPGVEEALGTVLAKNGLREKVFITSKLPTWSSYTRADIDKLFELSLEKLKTNYIDYYFLHMLSDMSTWERLKSLGIVEWIAQKKKSGQIKYICFSFHGPLDQFLQLLEVHDWEAVLIQYNYSNENYQAGVTGLKAAHKKGLPVFIMEPLLGGRLVSNLPGAIRAAFSRAHPDWSPAAWGLNWLWNQNEVTMVLSGMNEMQQLDDNLSMAERAASGMLSNEDMATFDEVRKIFNDSYKIKCTGCGYCMPCPKEINIPGCFAAYNYSYVAGYFYAMKRYWQTVGFTAKIMRNAGKCIKCGKCEKHCPQNLPVRENIMQVKKRLEPFFIWKALQLVRKFMAFK